MHLSFNNSHRDTKNYHGKIYIRKIYLLFTPFFHKINLVYTFSYNFKIFSNFFVYILLIYFGPPTRVPKFSTRML